MVHELEASRESDHRICPPTVEEVLPRGVHEGIPLPDRDQGPLPRSRALDTKTHPFSGRE